MSFLVSAFVKDKPISATIWVTKTLVHGPAEEARIFSKVARTSDGSLWTIRYMMGVPVALKVEDCRGFSVVYQPSEPPSSAPCSCEPQRAPDHFPQQPPAEAPVFLSGVPCVYREHASASTNSEIWYSYEYGTYVRMLLTTPGYGITDWHLSDIVLDEPASDLLAALTSDQSRGEHYRNIWNVAAEFFARST